MKQFLLVQWTGSEYDSLKNILNMAANELTAMGWTKKVLALEGDGPISEQATEQLSRFIQQEKITFALTMSGVGASLWTPQGQLLWEKVRVPCFTWYCDHPAYVPTRHRISNNYLVHGYVFPDHARFHQNYLSPNGLAFAVHMGIPSRPLFGGDPLPFNRRNGRILFAKSGGNPLAMEASWRTRFPKLIQDILLTAAEEMGGKSCGSMPEVVGRIAEAHDIFPTPDGNFMMPLFSELDDYLRTKQTMLVAESIKKYPVDVCGAAWDHFDWSGGQARFQGIIPFTTMVGQLPHYLGNLSTNPMVEESVHDRVFFALSTGVVPIGASNAFTRRTMEQLTPYTYPFQRDAIEAAVENLLDNPKQALQKTEETFQSLFPQFSMRHSMEQIIDFCALHPMNGKRG